ncbi:MAG TPA: hypothetical protein VGS41_04190 [Chthonomonadales bacterium]|nr:hypothetical protein [Chthonomonadales bacterium]
MNRLAGNRVSPIDLTTRQDKTIPHIFERGGRAVSTGFNGEAIDLPGPLHNVPGTVAEATTREEAVVLTHKIEAFTTRATANFRAVPRHSFVGLLEEGDIPLHHAATHRRAPFKELLLWVWAIVRAHAARSLSRLRRLNGVFVATYCEFW